MPSEKRGIQCYAVGFLALLFYGTAFGTYNEVRGQQYLGEEELNAPANNSTNSNSPADDGETAPESMSAPVGGISHSLPSEQLEDHGTEYLPPILGMRLKVTDALLVFFTFVLALFTGLLWRSTNKLWRSSTQQISVAQNAAKSAAVNADILLKTQRAFVYPRDFTTIVHRDKDGGVTGIEVRRDWENVGRMPAMGVIAYFDKRIASFDDKSVVQIVFEDKPELRRKPIAAGTGFKTVRIHVSVDELLSSWRQETRILFYAGCYFGDGVSEERQLTDHLTEVYVRLDPSRWSALPAEQLTGLEFVQMIDFEGSWRVVDKDRPMPPAVCLPCNHAFAAHGFAIDPGTEGVKFESVPFNCPRCGGSARIVDGTYDADETHLHIKVDKDFPPEALQVLNESIKRANEETDRVRRTNPEHPPHSLTRCVIST